MPGRSTCRSAPITSEAEAESRLGAVQQQASDLLDGHLPFTTSFTKEDAEWYRARFAGFSKGDAQSACDALEEDVGRLRGDEAE